MSSALDYLIAARPDAITSYFKFLKEAGKHLDPRTRDLISIITKVDSQTKGGFKQYLTRALRNGASPNEVLDALLMAFPTLGLAKIVWAIDILLEMDIPEFRPENLFSDAVWHSVLPENEIPLDSVTYRECDGRHLYIYRTATEIRVYDSRCPHQVTDIPHLALEGNKLTCPKHHWAFDITSGECVEVGNRPLNKFEHKVEGGNLLAYW